MGEVGVGREVNLVLFISLLKSIKSQKSWYKRHVNLVSVGLPEANSALRIHNQNVTTFALTTFGEANLSILTYLRNTQLYIILKRNWYFYWLSHEDPWKTIYIRHHMARLYEVIQIFFQFPFSVYLTSTQRVLFFFPSLQPLQSV